MAKLNNSLRNYRGYAAGPSARRARQAPQPFDPSMGLYPVAQGTPERQIPGLVMRGAKPPPGPKPKGPPKPPASMEHPPPFDPTYETRIGRIGEKYGNLVGQHKYGTDALSQEYGLEGEGAGTEIADPSHVLFNPFNRMKLLRESFQTANRATTGQMAERGQLYAGATQSRLDNNERARAMDEDRIRRDYAGGRRSLLDAWLTGTGQLGDEKLAADDDNLKFVTDPANLPSEGTRTPGQEYAEDLFQWINREQQKEFRQQDREAARNAKRGKGKFDKPGPKKPKGLGKLVPSKRNKPKGKKKGRK